jgi:HTH-type transcriptional regulator/antitoxin HigA
MSSDYIELLKRFPPRPLKTEEDLSAIQIVIDSLIDQGTLTEDERDYLIVLGILVYEYQQRYSSNAAIAIEPIKVFFGGELIYSNSTIASELQR